MNTMTYKGYSACIEYDCEDEIFFGRIAGISDSVTFHASTVSDLEAAFHEAVDDYVETCAKIGKSAEVDPGHAPEWTDEMLRRSELAVGGRVIRPATGTLTRPKLGDPK